MVQNEFASSTKEPRFIPSEPGETMDVSPHSSGFPAMRESVFRLNELLNSDAADLLQISHVVSLDPSLAAQVLHLTSFAAASESELMPFSECIVLLGMAQFRNVVFTAPLPPTDQATIATLEGFWRHSRRVAHLAEQIASECGQSMPFVAHAAALLHDIGKLVLAPLERESADQCSAAHCVAGAKLARSWRLPSPIVDAIEHHHEPGAARLDPLLVAMVAAADEISHLFEQRPGSEPRKLDSVRFLEYALGRTLPFLNSRRKRSLALQLYADLVNTRMM